MASTVTTRSIGNVGSNRPPTSSAARLTTPMSSVSGCVPVTMFDANETYSCSGVSPSTATPLMSSSCPDTRVRASPVRKPSRTAAEK